MDTMAIANRAFSSPSPITVTMAMASSKAGNASSTSMMRMITLSPVPPANPATDPKMVPMTIAAPTVAKPTISEIRVRRRHG